MITKEEAKKIADNYLANNADEHIACDVYEESQRSWALYTKRYKEEEVYYVLCSRKQLRGLESSMVLIICRDNGKVLDFTDSGDEG